MAEADILGYIIQGIFIAIGTAIGNYVATKGIVNHFEKVLKRVRKVDET